MKSVAVTSKPKIMEKRDLARLVDYYRHRLENVEKERLEVFEKLETLKASQEELHKTQWELRKRTDEVIELQNALSATNISLNHERKNVITLGNEIENYKLRSMEDRRRLVQMLQLAEPVEQTVKLYHDRRPEKLEKYTNSEIDTDFVGMAKASFLPQNKTMSNLNQKNENVGRNTLNKTVKSNTMKKSMSSKKFSSSNQVSSTKVNYRIPPSDEKQQIIRTILLPNDEKIGMRDEVEALQNHLREMKNYYENHILKLEEDRRLREEEFRIQNQVNKEKIEELMKKNHKLEDLNIELTKDYMRIKYDTQVKEKKLFEQLETFKVQNEALADTIKEITVKTDLEKEAFKNDYERKTKEISNVYRNQVKNGEENINIIKEQYKQIQNIYKTRVSDLEKKLKNIGEKYKTLETRRNNEIEGFLNEIKLVRKRMKTYENYVHKLKQMTSGGAIDVKKLNDINREIKETESKFNTGSKSLKSELSGLQYRLQNNLLNLPNPEDGVQDNMETNEENNENINNDYVEGRSDIIKEQSMNQSQQFSGNQMEEHYNNDDENYGHEEMNDEELEGEEMNHEEEAEAV